MYATRRRAQGAALLGVSLCLLYCSTKNNNLRKKRASVRKMHEDRGVNGFFERNYKKMREVDPEQFAMSTRMTVATFDLLLSLIRPRLEKTSLRTPISPECRLFVTLL